MILECVGDGEQLEILTRAHGNVADKIGKIQILGTLKLGYIQYREKHVHHFRELFLL